MHNTITEAKLFRPGDRVAIGASGGKDSTVLAYVMKTLNDRYKYGLELFLLSIDEGITGYRDDSLEVRSSHRPIRIDLLRNLTPSDSETQSAAVQSTAQDTFIR